MISKKNFEKKYEYGFSKPNNYEFRSKKGLTEETVREISKMKEEPEWMLNFRLNALKIFKSKNLPTWGGDLSKIDFDDIYYYLKPTKGKSRTWEDLPKGIKETYDKIGIPESEKAILGGVKAQYESEVVYGSLLKDLSDKGVIFTDTDSALKKYPELFKKYFATIVPPLDNKFAALNSAVWSGGSFLYIPKGVKVELPLQTYFRINSSKMGQFERTLIIADEGSQVVYAEGCSSPMYSEDSLHSAVVEIVVLKGARVRYITVQNWFNDVYNLVTKRAVAYEDSVMEWIDGNLGSKVTMKYPSVYLMGERAHGEILSIALASNGQHQDVGAKVIHVAPNTSSIINSKSICLNGGRTTYRGMVKVNKNASGCKIRVNCDALILDQDSRTDTYPHMEIDNKHTMLSHEASVSKLNSNQIYYLMSRGLSEEEAGSVIVSGFIEPILKELPVEHAVELNRLIELEMEGKVG
ncbi:MAG: Fe-S cluster assembly protein SufB [bacterium]